MCTLVVLILSIILGIVAGLAHPLLGLFVGGLVFFCGLPEALKCDWIHSEFDYLGSRIENAAAKNRVMQQIYEMNGESGETYNDNRQVHLHMHHDGANPSHERLRIK